MTFIVWPLMAAYLTDTARNQVCAVEAKIHYTRFPVTSWLLSSPQQVC